MRLGRRPEASQHVTDLAVQGVQTLALMAMVAAWAEYIGCMKIRNVVDPRFADPTDKWYDPHNLIFVGDDSRYAEGPFYVVHGRIISGILRSGLIPRLGGPEGAPLCSTLIAAHRRCVSQA